MNTKEYCMDVVKLLRERVEFFEDSAITTDVEGRAAILLVSELMASARRVISADDAFDIAILQGNLTDEADALSASFKNLRASITNCEAAP